MHLGNPKETAGSYLLTSLLWPLQPFGTWTSKQKLFFLSSLSLYKLFQINKSFEKRRGGGKRKWGDSNFHYLNIYGSRDRHSEEHTVQPLQSMFSALRAPKTFTRLYRVKVKGITGKPTQLCLLAKFKYASLHYLLHEHVFHQNH